MNEDKDPVKDEYLTLLQRIKLNREEVAENSSQLDELITRSNTLLHRISRPDELKLDAKVSTISTRMSLHNFEKDIRGNEMTTEKFINKLNQTEIKSGGFFIYAYSSFYGVKFKEVINFSIRKKESIKSPTERIIKNIKEVETPQSLLKNEDCKQELEIVLRIKTIILEKKKVHLFKCLVDPKSFSKTIENFFYLSFAIRAKIASLVSEEGEIYIVEYFEGGGKAGQHFVMEITSKEYNKIIKKYKIKDSYL